MRVQLPERSYNQRAGGGTSLYRVQTGARMARARQKQQKDRHQEILDAAARVITDRGLAETRIQDIAARCGVSPGLILYYFESKDRLLVEALTYANDKYYLAQSRELRRIPTARGQLERLVELSVPGLLDEYERLEEWALWLEIWVRALRDPSLAREREVLDRRWRQSIADIVRHGRETGEFPEGKDADDLGVAIGALIDGLAVQVMLNDTVLTPQRMKEMCLEVASSLIGFSLEPVSA